MHEYTVALLRHTRGGGIGPLTYDCEPPFGCWELNSEPVEEQSVFLTGELPSSPGQTFSMKNQVQKFKGKQGSGTIIWGK